MLKGIFIGLAIFFTCMFISNIVADLGSAIYLNNAVVKDKDKLLFLAKARIILAILLSVFWTLGILL